MTRIRLELKSPEVCLGSCFHYNIHSFGMQFMVIYSRIIFLIVLCFGQHKISLHSLPNGKQRLAAQKCEKTVARGISLGLNHCQSQRTNWGVYIISTRRERTFQPDATVNTHTHNCPEYRQQTCKYFLTHYLNKSTEIERQTIDSLFQEHAPPSSALRRGHFSAL